MLINRLVSSFSTARILKSFDRLRSAPRCRCYDTNASLLEMNTNVAKDVVLYKSDNTKFYKYVSLFGMTQFGFWVYLGHWAFTSMKDAPVDPEKISDDTPWWKKINLGENKYKNGITIFCFGTGWIMLAGSWMLTLRAVRLLVLRKGGKAVSFVTYTPFGKDRIMDVPIRYVSAADSRHSAKVNLPVKVHGKWFYYMLDMRGEFRNTRLFDATVGLRRTLVK